MNLADYLSELLGQHDEVILPGLGYFVRERVDGYYNDKEEKFYPPYHHVRFVPELRNDDTFTQYVAQKKNISLASSKYFTEKFVGKLKEDAAKDKYLFSDLGLFYTDQDQLTFKPNEKIMADPSFYGYPPISINKAGKPKRAEPVKPSIPVVVKTPAPDEVTEPPFKTLRQLQQEQYLEEEYEQKRSVNIWWILLIVVSALALALFGVYKFYPSVFSKINKSYHKTFTKEKAIVPVAQPVTKPDTLNPDTVIKAGPGADTSKAIAPPGSATGIGLVDSTNVPHFVVIAGAFKTEEAANALVEHYRAIGLRSTILPPLPGGKLIRVSAGTYLSRADAETAKTLFMRSGKIPIDSEVEQIKPDK